jgi:ribonuclease E
MKTKSFCVPADKIVEFAEIVEGYELDSVIVGTDDDNDDCVVVSVEYESEDREGVFELVELLDDDDEDEDEDEEDDDDEDDDDDDDDDDE